MRANASDAFGIASVQFDIDGANFGVPVTTPDSGTFSYSASLDVSGLAAEAHQLQATATDITGNKIRTAARSFNVGVAPPTISLVVPPRTVGSLSGFGAVTASRCTPTRRSHSSARLRWALRHRRLAPRDWGTKRQ